MDESNNDGIVVWESEVWELLAILGRGSPKIPAANWSAMLGLGCSGGGGEGGISKEWPCYPNSPPRWESNPMWEVLAHGAKGCEGSKFS
jgi:hypothetical protein